MPELDEQLRRYADVLDGDPSTFPPVTSRPPLPVIRLVTAGLAVAAVGAILVAPRLDRDAAGDGDPFETVPAPSASDATPLISTDPPVRLTSPIPAPSSPATSVAGPTGTLVVQPSATEVGGSAASATVPSGTPSQYLVVSGDSLFLIARRFGCDWKQILEFNGLAEDQPIFPGDLIDLPVGCVTRTVATTLPAGPAASVPSSSIPTTLGPPSVYVVVNGDFPIRVEKVLGCAWETIADYNDLTGFPTPGTEILVPPSCEAGAAVGVDGEFLTYEVQAGDYPMKLAKQFGCAWEVMAAYNHIDRFPFPGDTINIPPTECRASAER